MDCIDLVDKKSVTELGHIIKFTKWVRIDLVDWFSDRFCIQRYQKSGILSKSPNLPPHSGHLKGYAPGKLLHSNKI